MEYKTELSEAFRSALGGPLDCLNELSWQPPQGAQWGRILGVPGVVMDLRRHGGRICIRFRSGDCRSKHAIYNEGLLNGVATGVATGDRSGDRSGDTSNPF